MKRHHSKIDSLTRYELILSDVSYNVACDWLEKDMAKYGLSIYKTGQVANPNMTVLYAGRFSNITNDWRKARMFFYDENRGYLLGE